MRRASEEKKNNVKRIIIRTVVDSYSRTNEVQNLNEPKQRLQFSFWFQAI